jgi:hypothetical protein
VKSDGEFTGHEGQNYKNKRNDHININHKKKRSPTSVAFVLKIQFVGSNLSLFTLFTGNIYYIGIIMILFVLVCCTSLF